MLRDIRLGDWAVLLAAASMTTILTLSLWRSGPADKLVVRSGGKIFAELSLTRNAILPVPGPLGLSQVQVANRKARIAADPSPRQYCVKQGWLSQPGEAAICLPNQVSIEIEGGSYDTLNY